MSPQYTQPSLPQSPTYEHTTSSPSLSLSFNISSPLSQPSSPTSSVFSSSSSTASTMSSNPVSDAATMAEALYFNSNPPPKGLEQHTSLARDFIAQHAATGTRVVLVSSGGTTVPLGKSPPISQATHPLTPLQKRTQSASSTTSQPAPAALPAQNIS